MNEQVVMDIARNALTVTLEISAPLLLAALAVGMVVSIFQAVTQINEATLSFVPKILAIGAVLAVMGPWIEQRMVSYTVGVFNLLPSLAH